MFSKIRIMPKSILFIYSWGHRRQIYLHTELVGLLFETKINILSLSEKKCTNMTFERPALNRIWIERNWRVSSRKEACVRERVCVCTHVHWWKRACVCVCVKGEKGEQMFFIQCFIGFIQPDVFVLGALHIKLSHSKDSFFPFILIWDGCNGCKRAAMSLKVYNRTF